VFWGIFWEILRFFALFWEKWGGSWEKVGVPI
jgi:hypothetical protein